MAPPGTRARIRCTVAVWEPQARDTIRTWLAANPEVEVLDSPASVDQTPRALHQHQPDIVLVEASPGAAGLRALKDAAACGPGLCVLAVGRVVSAHTVRAAFTAGAHGLFTLADGPEQLAVGIRDVFRHGRYVSPRTAAVLLNAFLERPSALTQREIQVLSLMARSVPVREIGRHLSIASKTIDSHKQSIFRKLGVHSQRDAVRRGYELGFLGGTDAGRAEPEPCDSADG